MRKKTLIIIVFFLMSIATTLVAQAAVIDLSQTILLEGSALKFSVIVHQSETAFFTIDLVDNKGRLLQNHAINPAEGVNNYALEVPVDSPEQVWLVIRNGEQTQIQELLILDRPKQLMEQSASTAEDSLSETPALALPHKQRETICLQDPPATLMYLSSTAVKFRGILLQFDTIKDFVHYPVTFESGQIDQAFLFDAGSMKSLKISQDKNKTAVKLMATNAGSALFAVNKLTNLPENINVSIDLPTEKSAFSKVDSDNRKWLANQLLIDELVTPLSDKDFSANKSLQQNTNWQADLGIATVDLKPQNYVAFDDMKSFLSGLARNLRIYTSGEGYGSYIYPTQRKASFRQPLYLIDGQIAVLDDLLAMRQEDIFSIQVYTEGELLIQTLGPVASAGLILVNSAEPKTRKSRVTVGQMLAVVSGLRFDGPLSPLAFMSATSQNCYEHNMRLGVFKVNGLSIEGQALKIHSEQINITALSK